MLLKLQGLHSKHGDLKAMDQIIRRVQDIYEREQSPSALTHLLLSQPGVTGQSSRRVMADC